MHTTLTRLRHIVAVARTGSFSVAAEEAAISQPALSRSIQAFETEYNVRLFDRGRGGVALTAEGALAVEQARNVLAAASELDRCMSMAGRGVAGRVGIGFGPLVASVLIPGLGKGLLRSYPNVQFVSKVKPADQLVEALFDGEIDAIIGNTGHLSQIPGVTQELLGTMKLTMAVRKGHPLASRSRLKVEELTPFPIASTVEGPNGFAPSLSGCIVSENSHILREVVLETDCVWLTTPSFISDTIAQGEFVQLPVTNLQPAETEIWVALRRGRSRSLVLSLLLDNCREVLAQCNGVPQLS